MSLFTRSKSPEPTEVRTLPRDGAPSGPPAAARTNAVAPDPGEPLPAVDAALEADIQRLGGEFLTLARKHKTGLLSSAFWSDKLMDWAMQDEAFKIQLFRFVDAFPRLKTPEQVHEHLVDYLGQPGVTLPPGLGMGIKAGGLLKGAMTKTITSRITGMAGKFIAGRDAATALPLLRKLWDRGLAFSVDLLGEACVSQAEALSYQERYLDLVRTLPEAARTWPANARLETDHLGPVPRANVSVKISALDSEVDPIAADDSIDRLVEALRPILEAARDGDVLINFDMEQYALKNLTLDLFMRCCDEIDFPAGLAMQAYLRSGDRDAQRIITWAKRTGRQVTVRLVKGAYWDYETIRADTQGRPVPVWSRKADSDACFERMTQQFIEATPRHAGEGGVKLAVGSHNARSIAAALALLERHGLPTSAIELQMLHGMGDQLKGAALERGLRLREYLPVGEMIPGMAYLVRRLLENTSNESWLRAGFADDASPATLLATPHRRYAQPDPGIDRFERAPEIHRLTPAVPGVGDGRPFHSEPMRDFAQAAVRDAFVTAIDTARVPRVGADATEADADRALAAAQAALPGWRARDPRERAAVLTRAAAIMRGRRDELCGIIIREAGKTWIEADGEVCEAIDFCDYYARMAVPLFEPQRLGRYVGELNEVVYQPRGVAAIIAPWNFPLAILCGMTTAALVTGNPVLIKPAGSTLGIGRVFHQILLEAGCPDDVAHFVPGPGRTVGARMVADPRTALIAFTGSLEVGLDIIARAGQVPAGQTHVKKVIAEMGGKNAVIVDASADLDEAVHGVRGSAFGYQGQKCSACSRAIVVASAYDVFLERLCASAGALTIGDPLDPTVDLGPVIDRAAYESISAMIEVGKQESRLALEGDVPDTGLVPQRDYVAPHIFAEVPPTARIATEEIFGPVLSVMKVETFEEAIALANATGYKLTAGVYSRKPSHIDAARRDLRVGNLYINRSITGAQVGRQPFGGLGLSGVGTKAGGPDYLLHFVEPRTICENTMRQGFAPDG